MRLKMQASRWASSTSVGKQLLGGIRNWLSRREEWVSSSSSCLQSPSAHANQSRSLPYRAFVPLESPAFDTGVGLAIKMSRMPLSLVLGSSIAVRLGLGELVVSGIPTGVA